MTPFVLANLGIFCYSSLFWMGVIFFLSCIVRLSGCSFENLLLELSTLTSLAHFPNPPVNTLLFPRYIHGHKLPIELALQYGLFSWNTEKRLT